VLKAAGVEKVPETAKPVPKITKSRCGKSPNSDATQCQRRGRRDEDHRGTARSMGVTVVD
jgi:hypothetical protein